jgi:hypothetical protein
MRAFAATMAQVHYFPETASSRLQHNSRRHRSGPGYWLYRAELLAWHLFGGDVKFTLSAEAARSRSVKRARRWGRAPCLLCWSCVLLCIWLYSQQGAGPPKPALA